MPTQTMEITNIKGLHARASAKFAEVCEEFDAEATVRKDGMESSCAAHSDPHD